MPNEIVPHDNDALVQEPEAIISADDNTVKVLRLSHHDKDHDYKKMLAAAVQLLSAVDIIGKIQKGAEFIVQVPAQYQAELQAGALEMMHGAKSGKTWATLVRKLADGKQEIVCNCPITEQMRLQGNPVQNLSGVYQNLYMQQKLAELSEQVQEVYDAVLRIEQGQMDDRIGKLISGRNDAMRALENPKSEARERELELARSKISEAQSQIGQVFKSRIEDFKPIPESKLARQFQGDPESLYKLYEKTQMKNSVNCRSILSFILEQLSCWPGPIRLWAILNAPRSYLNKAYPSCALSISGMLGRRIIYTLETAWMTLSITSLYPI